MPFYLYWDDSDPNNPSYLKLRRATYATLAEAKGQAEHDLACQRCNSTGQEDSPWGPQTCRDCGGDGLCPSKNIVCIEESKEPLGATETLTSGVMLVELDRGTIVWEP